MKLNKNKKISFLISGGGSNLLEILKKNSKNKDLEIVTVISNNTVPIKIKYYINKYYKDVLVKECQSKLNKKNFFDSNIIFSLGYMKVIEKDIIDNFYVINLHPSILPKYKGLMTQKRMLINNEKNYGFTIHKVSNELDEGESISNQIRKIITKDESKLLYQHKILEHKFVYKKLIDFLLN